MNTHIFAALADPMRRQLLMQLARSSPKTATELAREYPISRQGILKHLNILEQAGLVEIHQHGRDKRYSLTPEPLSTLEDWIAELTHTWDQRLLRLKTMLENESSDSQE